MGRKFDLPRERAERLAQEITVESEGKLSISTKLALDTDGGDHRDVPVCTTCCTKPSVANKAGGFRTRGRATAVPKWNSKTQPSVSYLSYTGGLESFV